VLCRIVGVGFGRGLVNTSVFALVWVNTSVFALEWVNKSVFAWGRKEQHRGTRSGRRALQATGSCLKLARLPRKALDELRIKIRPASLDASSRSAAS
jgi:hypothetical protein